jgi:BlaI family transcriptional regulator, penicillinase repressor
MPPTPRDHRLSRRERQIMDVLHARQQATVSQVLEDLPDPPSYSAIRALLRILEEKGYVRHREEANRYVYLPRVSRQAARRSALRRVVTTFFEGSVTQAMAALLEDRDTRVSEEEWNELRRLIDQARSEGQ